MKPASESSNQEVLAGLVERVTFHNAEIGFCVLRTKARGHRDLVTVVGHAAIISAGEWITASGEWNNDRAHGQQFKARFLKTSAPSSIDGIEKYLGSGMIRGIGPVYAKKMVKAFGEKVFDVIEAEPDRLREVTGIGAVRAKRIRDAWAEQKIVREIMVFLHSNGVGTARAVRIFKTYGADAVQVMTENPYRLARDIRGIGFKSADAIAMKLGIEKTAMIRLRAGISYALTEAMDDGHCGLPTDQLIPLAEELLEAPKELILTALELERSDGAVIADTVDDTDCIFLAGLYRAEQAITERLIRIVSGGLTLEADDQIVRVTNDDHVALSLPPSPALSPKIEAVIQVDVGKERRNHQTSSRSPIIDRHDPIFEDARLQPLLDQAGDALVADPVFQEANQPTLADRPEEVLDVGVKYPVHFPYFDRRRQRVQRIVRPSPGSEPV